MEPRKDDVRSATQSSIRGSSSSACTSYPVPEYPVAGTVKPVLNYSIQTGEEFSLEFMRAIPKKHLVPGMPHNQNVTSSAGHKDSRVSLVAPRTGGETRFDASIFLTSGNHQPDEVERKPFSENENRRRHMSSTSVPRVPSGGGSSQGLFRGYASSEASESSRMIKILCSFGGKILPRPSDGKLRYVGGETHIIRISRDISWQELKQKTTAVCNQPHVIKYQLPGEDLDALISVSNDEDLRNMMEECGLLDNGDGSQKLRIFLVSSIEFDDMSFSLGSMDSDSGIQYVAAINGMDGITANSSSGQGLVNTSLNESDQFINLNFDSRLTNSSRDSSNLHAVNASTFMRPEMHPRPMPSALYNDNTSNLRSYYTHVMHNLQGSDYSNPATSERFHDIEVQRMHNLQGSDYSNPATSERFHEIEGQISIPVSTPSDYRYTSQYAPFSGTASQRSLDQQSYQDAQTEASVKEEKGFSGNMPNESNELDYFQSLENLSGHSKHHDSSASNYMHSGAPPTVCIQEGVTSSLQPSDSVKSLETCTMPRARSTTQGSDISEDDRHSGGAFASGCSDFQADMVDHSYKNQSPHPGRVFHSEWIPREQAGFLNRLSKSEDSLNPELLIRQSQSGVASEHIAENIDSAFAGTEKPNLAAQAINLNDPAVDDSLIQFEKGFTNTVQQASPFSEHLLGEKRPSDDTSGRNVDQISHAAQHVVAKGKLNEENFQDVETTNQLDSHAAVPHHISWDAPKPTLPTDCEHDPVVPCSASSLDVSHKETIIPSTQIRDIASSTERTSPDILSDFFANANSSAQSSSPFIDPIHSLNMPNYEPQRWSFFRNLAQNEFPKKDEAQDLAKIEEGVYPLDHLEHDTTNVKNLDLQSDTTVEVPSIVSRTNVDPSISIPGFVSSQIDNPTTTKNVEGFQVDNPFTNMHEMMPSHLDFEEQKTEEGRAVGPVMDASFKDNDFEYLQIIKNEDLEELRELGSGTFGTVYHGKWRGSDVAIKRIKKSCFTGRSSELERLAHEFWREAEILSKLHHPNVVAFYGVVKDGPGGTLATVTEFMVNGSLRHVLQRKDKYLDRRKRLIIAMDAAFGLEYLHSKNIVHFDLKCDNLLVNLKDQSRPICKVGDFGLSKIKRNTLVSGGVRGTLPWMAPELLNGSSNKVSEKVDVFSFGIVMWEILTGEEPYANMHYGAIIGGIVNNTLRPHVPASCDPEWRRLMEQCWAPDPAQRPAFTEIAGRLRSMSVAANQAKATK
uniref:Protein kinase domain-containing protein n=3 Tax=Zea mays TaxID=4577 RepID=A0A804PT82_MAIZE